MSHLLRRDSLRKSEWGAWEHNVLSTRVYSQESPPFDFTFLCLILVFSLYALDLMEINLMSLHKSNTLEGNVSIYAYVGIMYGCWEGKGLSF